ncbi:TPR repeat-containing protein [Rhodopirellula maiorica SM1]|uniref:TPR repeat-containing protein n=1 Tax=Rhodopirellula maiorica SM1 TaxID=1265738 RepID=M5RG80_9BACT|nr:TPR repeat-containing protein [Rhodopirellula maiorica SM1]
MIIAGASLTSSTTSAAPPQEPVVARVEMKLTDGEKVADVIEKGDLLTVIEERDNDYVILTHDGSRGAVDKVNAVRLAESTDIYTDLIERNPDEGRFLTLRASAWWALGKSEKAVEDFDQAIKLGYKEPHAYSSRGLFHAAIGNFDKAIADYNMALELDPESIAPLINRAAVYMAQGEVEKAIKDYTAALKSKPANASLLRQRAIALKAAGKLDQAIEDFDSILQANEKDVDAISGRGYIYFQQGNHEAAVKDFSRVIELTPESAVAFNNRGYNQFQLGNAADALADYDKAIELAPQYGLALQNRAWLLTTAEDTSLRDPAKAIESAKAACELSDYSNLGDLSALAAAFAADGKFEEAIGWQEKVVENAPEPHQEFAKKILQRYQDKKPFSANPDEADVASENDPSKDDVATATQSGS